VSEWAFKFGRARHIRSPSKGGFADKWHLDEMVVIIKGKKYRLWRAVDAEGYVLDDLLQSRRHKKAARRVTRKMLKCQGAAMIPDKLGSYSAGRNELMPGLV
jgi:putative transposase